MEIDQNKLAVEQLIQWRQVFAKEKPPKVVPVLQQIQQLKDLSGSQRSALFISWLWQSEGPAFIQKRLKLGEKQILGSLDMIFESDEVLQGYFEQLISSKDNEEEDSFTDEFVLLSQQDFPGPIYQHIHSLVRNGKFNGQINRDGLYIPPTLPKDLALLDELTNGAMSSAVDPVHKIFPPEFFNPPIPIVNPSDLWKLNKSLSEQQRRILRAITMGQTQEQVVTQDPTYTINIVQGVISSTRRSIEEIFLTPNGYRRLAFFAQTPREAGKLADAARYKQLPAVKILSRFYTNEEGMATYRTTTIDYRTEQISQLKLTSLMSSLNPADYKRLNDWRRRESNIDERFGITIVEGIACISAQNLILLQQELNKAPTRPFLEIPEGFIRVTDVSSDPYSLKRKRLYHLKVTHPEYFLKIGSFLLIKKDIVWQMFENGAKEP